MCEWCWVHGVERVWVGRQKGVCICVSKGASTCVLAHTSTGCCHSRPRSIPEERHAAGVAGRPGSPPARSPRGEPAVPHRRVAAAAPPAQVFLIALMCSTSLRRKHPWNILALIAFTLVESVLVGCICSYWDVGVVLEAFAVTCAAVAGLTLMAIFGEQQGSGEGRGSGWEQGWGAGAGGVGPARAGSATASAGGRRGARAPAGLASGRAALQAPRVTPLAFSAAAGKFDVTRKGHVLAMASGVVFMVLLVTIVSSAGGRPRAGRRRVKVPLAGAGPRSGSPLHWHPGSGSIGARCARAAGLPPRLLSGPPLRCPASLANRL